jgi:hypothetical protein
MPPWRFPSIEVDTVPVLVATTAEVVVVVAPAAIFAYTTKL